MRLFSFFDAGMEGLEAAAQAARALGAAALPSRADPIRATLRGTAPPVRNLPRRRNRSAPPPRSAQLGPAMHPAAPAALPSPPPLPARSPPPPPSRRHDVSVAPLPSRVGAAPLLPTRPLPRHPLAQALDVAPRVTAGGRSSGRSSRRLSVGRGGLHVFSPQERTVPQPPIPIQKINVCNFLGYSRADRNGLNASARRACRGLDRAVTMTKQTPASLTRAVIALETSRVPLQRCIRSWGACALISRHLASVVRSSDDVASSEGEGGGSRDTNGRGGNDSVEGELHANAASRVPGPGVGSIAEQAAYFNTLS